MHVYKWPINCPCGLLLFLCVVRLCVAAPEVRAVGGEGSSGDTGSGITEGIPPPEEPEEQEDQVVSS